MTAKNKMTQANLLDGKHVAYCITNELKKRIQELPSLPHLTIIQVEGDVASSIYVKHKVKVAAEVGIHAQHILLAASVSQTELHHTLQTINQDPTIHGILLQLPLPSHLSVDEALAIISPHKDVDGLTVSNLGHLMRKNPLLIPCTPLGIVRLLEFYKIDFIGKHIAILNSSPLVGRPLALLCLAQGATPTLCNSQTKHREHIVNSADILVSATGKAHAVATEWIKPGAVVIDVGVHRDPTLGLVGDVNFANASQVASWITPVPGGVGPMTIAILMENVVKAYSLQHNA